MVTILLLFILALLSLTVGIIGCVGSWQWRDSDGAVWCRAFGFIISSCFMVALIVLSGFLFAENSNTKKLQVQAWYDETVLTLDSTKEYISTITDDYARSVAVNSYNKDVKNFKLQIKNSKYKLDNGWINWFVCPVYKELDENVVDYIK